MPRIEAYRCRFTNEVFSSRLEFKNHLLILRDLERQRRADRKTNVDPEHLRALWTTMREQCTTFEEIAAYMIEHGKELGYHCALQTADFQSKLASGSKILDWPTIKFVSFGFTEFKQNLPFGNTQTFSGWRPIMTLYVEHCWPKFSEDILHGSGIMLDRKINEPEVMQVYMFVEGWSGLCSSAAIEILSRSMVLDD